ncbi:carbohydrate-binding domain-containing protein [Arcicella aquatica]|uniref:Carbohydrate-binding domain-containing protein n=1 Tax=Arcicella aquatica TaxID=217141 RepID=A0ABU5QL81_9BACT|nr:carbohydrate-binding domain-containing protein [Arcicella aquatica]MEA5257545.1 carbohydrate-binding domain-containing protein [Arcicella aquatica]
MTKYKLIYLLLVLSTIGFVTSILSCKTASEEEVIITPVVIDGDFDTKTKDTTFANAVVIKYSGTTATVTNPFESSGVKVSVTNGNVVVTSTTTTTEVNYVLSGSTTEGSLKLYSDYKFNLIMNGVSIIHSSGPAINIQSGKKVSVNLLSGTNNRLVDGTAYATNTEDQKGAFFSEGQLNFAGTGALTVIANYKHGICSDDYIAIKEGTITVTQAVSDGIHANDYFKMEGGTLSITSSGDGIDCEEGYVALSGGNIIVTSVDDGITASYDGTDTSITPYVSITGGTINVTTTGEKGNAIKSEGYTTVNNSSAITLKVSGRASKGFKTTGNLTLTNVNTSITTSGNAFYDTSDSDIASAAGINCDGNFVMQQGTVTINSTGTAGKGITVDGTSMINGGTINITTTGAAFTSNNQDSEAKGIKSDGALVINDGTITISAADDGIKSDASITFNKGDISITKSTEGIEAPKITVNNGTINVLSSDDCFNSTNGNGGESNDGSLMTFTGGVVTVSSTGGDPLDSNGSISMTGGTVVAQGPPSQPEVAIDYNGTFNISGGLLIASGPSASRMAQATSTTSAQNTVFVKLNSVQASGTLFTVQDASGNNLVTYAPARAAGYFVFSSPSLATNATYKVLTGGSYANGTNTGGYYSGGNYTGGTQKGTFTVSSKVTTVTY